MIEINITRKLIAKAARRSKRALARHVGWAGQPLFLGRFMGFNDFSIDSCSKFVIKSYAKWFSFVVFTAIVITCKWGTNSWLGIWSLIFAATGLGKRNIQTWAGNSPAENLQNRLQMLLGLLTLIFGTAALI